MCGKKVKKEWKDLNTEDKRGVCDSFMEEKGDEIDDSATCEGCFSDWGIKSYYEDTGGAKW